MDEDAALILFFLDVTGTYLSSCSTVLIKGPISVYLRYLAAFMLAFLTLTTTTDAQVPFMSTGAFDD